MGLLAASGCGAGDGDFALACLLLTWPKRGEGGYEWGWGRGSSVVGPR